MELERKVIHELKNYLTVGMGMIELAMKSLAREGKETDLDKINERLFKALESQKKILEVLNSIKKPESNDPQ